MSDNAARRESILVSDYGTVTVRQDVVTKHTYLRVDDDFTTTEMCLSLAQHEQLIEALRHALPPSAKRSETVTLIREAYQHWTNIGWPEDKECVAKLKKALVLMEGE